MAEYTWHLPPGQTPWTLSSFIFWQNSHLQHRRGPDVAVPGRGVQFKLLSYFGLGRIITTLLLIVVMTERY